MRASTTVLSTVLPSTGVGRHRRGARRRRRRRRLRHRAAELERPQEVAPRPSPRTGAGAAGVDGHVLLAVDLVRDRAAADRRAGLEPPQSATVARVEREQVAVRLADEDQVAGRA